MGQIGHVFSLQFFFLLLLFLFVYQKKNMCLSPGAGNFTQLVI